MTFIIIRPRAPRYWQTRWIFRDKSHGNWIHLGGWSHGRPTQYADEAQARDVIGFLALHDAEVSRG